MMTPLPIRTMEQFKDVLYAFRLPGLLATSLELDVFTHMGKRVWTPKVLAKALGANDRAVEFLLRNLHTVGLVFKQGAAYGVGPLGRTYLNRNSPDYQGAYLDLIVQQWQSWAQLKTVIRNPEPIENNDPASRRSFTWAMHQRSLKPAREVAAQLNLKNVTSLLDVGGGPGTYALEFFKKHPKLHAGIWDREDALDVARQIAEPLRHGARLSCHAGDLFDDPVPGTFDVMWVSNVVHMFSPVENRTLFYKLRRAIPPGGRILIQDTFLMNRPGFNALETNLFAITMLLYSRAGNTYSAQEVQRWLTICGFHQPRCLQLKKGTGDWDGVIIEATRR